MALQDYFQRTGPQRSPEQMARQRAQLLVNIPDAQREKLDERTLLVRSRADQKTKRWSKALAPDGEARVRACIGYAQSWVDWSGHGTGSMALCLRRVDPCLHRWGREVVDWLESESKYLYS